MVTTCIKLLEVFGIAKDVKRSDIKNFKKLMSGIGDLGPVYVFDYEDIRYYAVDDPSLWDDPKQVNYVLEDVGLSTTAKLLKNPAPLDDEHTYCVRLYGMDAFYLLQVTKEQS